MPDRRRTQRFEVGPPLRGDATSMQDVVVERINGDFLTIVSLTAHEPGQPLTIHVSMSDGLKSHRTRVLSSTPISVGATVQYRVELRILSLSGEQAES